MTVTRRPRHRLRHFPPLLRTPFPPRQADTLFPSLIHTVDALLLILLFSKIPPRSILGLVCPNTEELEIEGEPGEECWCSIVPLFSFQVFYSLRDAQTCDSKSKSSEGRH